MGKDGAKAESGWKPSLGVWLAVLGLTVASVLYFQATTPDAPLGGASLTFVAFFWFVVAMGVKWVRMHFKARS